MDSNAVLGITPPNRLFMFPQSDFQCPLCLADVDSVTILAGDFIHDSFILLLGDGSLNLLQGLSQGFHWSEGRFDSYRGAYSLHLLAEASNIW